MDNSTSLAEYRDYKKFFTPPDTAKFMVWLLGDTFNYTNPLRILEPSAGDGALLKALASSFLKAQVTAIELNPQHRDSLKALGALVITDDFLKVDFGKIRYDGVIANPPFGNGIDLQAHFEKMWILTKSEGRIVSIVPADFSPDVKYTSHPLQNWGTNKDGTVTRIKIIVVDKVD